MFGFTSQLTIHILYIPFNSVQCSSVERSFNIWNTTNNKLNLFSYIFFFLRFTTSLLQTPNTYFIRKLLCNYPSLKENNTYMWWGHNNIIYSRHYIFILCKKPWPIKNVVVMKYFKLYLFQIHHSLICWRLYTTVWQTKFSSRIDRYAWVYNIYYRYVIFNYVDK